MIAASTAVPTPPKTSCQLSAMNFIASFLLKLIGREKSGKKAGSQQSISSGDGSQNYQAFRDVTVHNHAPPPPVQSLIEKPTLEQIRLFDPRTAKIVRMAETYLSESLLDDAAFTVRTKESEEAVRKMVEKDAEISASDKQPELPDLFNTVIITNSIKTEHLLATLEKSRVRLQVLKVQYMDAVRRDGGIQSNPSGKRRIKFHEIVHTIEAMEALKDELVLRGAHFDIDLYDHEHPNAAYKRVHGD
jgi:hypothetical protein